MTELIIAEISLHEKSRKRDVLTFPIIGKTGTLSYRKDMIKPISVMADIDGLPSL